MRLAANPMQGPVLDILEHPEVREAAIMKAVQTGISKLIQALEAKQAHTDPCMSLLVLPSREAGRDQIKKHWGPMLRGKDCEILKPLQRKRASRSRTATALQRNVETVEVDRSTYQNIVLSNGHDLLLGYSGSVQSLASHPCKRVKFDETDKFNDWDGDEASPIMLGRRRTETYQESYQIVSISTPTTENGEIYQLFDASEIKLYPFIVCPHCAAPIQVMFDNVRWDLPPATQMPDERERAALLRNEPERVYLHCAACNGKVSEAQRKTLLASTGYFSTPDQKWQFHVDGREIGTKPPGTRVGIHFPQLVSLMGSTMPTQAARWVEAQGSIKAIQDCKNNDHGWPFVFDLVKPAKGLLKKKCEDDPDSGFVAGQWGVVPSWASRLILTVDTQKNKFYWVIRAWGARLRSRLVACGEAMSFEQLEELMDRTWWPNEDPTLPARRVTVCAIDSGGGIDRENEDATRTVQVYRWCARDAVRRVALKGVRSKKYDGAMTKLVPHKYQNDQTGETIHFHLLWVSPLDTGDVLANAMQAQLEVIDPKTGEICEQKVDLWELNRRTPNDYLRHMEVMTRKTIKKGTKRLTKYVPEVDGARHDYHDLERYQQGVANDPIMGCAGLPDEAQLRADLARRTNVKPPTTGGIKTDDGREFLATQR